MLKNYLLLLLIGCIWGSQFALNHFALQENTEMTISFFRAAFGAFTLAIVLYFYDRKNKEHFGAKEWLSFALIALFETVIPLQLILWAQQEIESSLASILISTVPLWAIALAYLTEKKENKPNWQDGMGVLIGFAGVCLLLADGFQGGFSLVRAMALLLAACCFAIAIVLIKKLLGQHSPIRATRNILLMASLLLLFMAIAQGESLRLHVSPLGLTNLLVLGIVCTGFVWVLYATLIRRAGVAFTSMANYLVPPVGFFLGMLQGEKIDAKRLIALGMILIGLLFKWLWQRIFAKSGKHVK